MSTPKKKNQFDCSKCTGYFVRKLKNAETIAKKEPVRKRKALRLPSPILANQAELAACERNIAPAKKIHTNLGQNS